MIGQWWSWRRQLTLELPPGVYTAAMDDLRIADLRRRLAGHSAWQAPRETGQIEAAVTAVLRAGESLELLLIERVERAEDPWSGHMALPGGRRDAEDPDLLATALRETAEEVGIVLDPAVELLGALDEVYPQTRLLPPLVIAPFVAAVGLDVEARPDPGRGGGGAVGAGRRAAPRGRPVGGPLGARR